MWLYIPSPESEFAPESDGSTLPPDSLGSTTDSPITLWLSVSGTLMQRPFSWRGWKTRPWSERLFATASKTSTNDLVEWIALSLASPAPILATLANDRESPAIPVADYSLKSCGPFAIWDAAGSFWRTSQRSLLSDWILYLQSWPKQGSMRNGCVYARPMWAPTTDEIGGSVWSTARSEDAENCGNHPQATDSLTGATREWATPTAHDAHGTNSTSTQHRDLQRESEQWMTPHTPTAHASDNSETTYLGRQIQEWMTPLANDYKGSWKPGQRRGQLSEQTESSRQDQQIPNGQISSDKPRGSRPRLNPMFTEFLMGAIPGWTIAAPTSFVASAMESWYCKLLSHLRSCLGG
jgi:hypothetical protein